MAPELEFYLTKPNTDPNEPIEPPLGRTGRKGASRQAYSMVAVDEYGEVIDTIYDFAEAQGLEIDTVIQEGRAPGRSRSTCCMATRSGRPIRFSISSAASARRR